MGAPQNTLRGSALVSLALVSLLAGCAGAPEPKPTNSEPSAEVTPTTPPDSGVDETADILFTITANVRASDGRTIGISMAAHQPVASTEPGAAEIRDQFLGLCGDGNGSQPITEAYLEENGSTLMRVEFRAKTPGLTFASPIELFFGSPYFAQAAIGEGVTPAPGGQKCFYGFSWAKSGDVRGIADFENSEGVPDPKQWFFGRYGFAVNPSSGATIEACKVTMTELGMKSGVTEQMGWDPTAAATGISCGIGYSGE